VRDPLSQSGRVWWPGGSTSLRMSPNGGSRPRVSNRGQLWGIDAPAVVDHHSSVTSPWHDERMSTEQQCLEGDPWPFLDDNGAELVARYFDPTGGFSGGQFEHFCGGGDAPECQDAFTAADLLSVTLLDVMVPGLAAISILGELGPRLNGHLGAIPADRDLWDVPLSDVEVDSEADMLWYDLVALKGIAWVTAAKLMARKRPRLIPVYDSVVHDALSPSDGNFWLALRGELGDAGLRQRLTEMRSEAVVTEDISLLRVLDAAVWMRNRRSSAHQLPFVACPRHHRNP